MDPWLKLKRFTDARIALGRAGDSLTTQALLDFGLAHARARDAVHEELNVQEVGNQIREAGFEPIDLHSAAADRDRYLRRPDLGRQLDPAGREKLQKLVAEPSPDVVFVIADGLSAKASRLHAVPVLQAVCAKLPDWRIGPVVIAQQARVALSDEIGEVLKARAVVILIGERPGLSSPDSLGAYLTYNPRTGRTDAERNCVSNIRPNGLAYEPAAHLLHYLLIASEQRKLSGIALKDDSDQPPALPS